MAGTAALARARLVVGVVCVTGVAMALASTAEARVCAARKISATGQTAQLSLIAKVAARSAWSSKVAFEPRLGPRYSTWLRGQERRIVCRKVERRHICLAIALPCRAGAFLTPATASIPAVDKADPKRRPL